MPQADLVGGRRFSSVLRYDRRVNCVSDSPTHPERWPADAAMNTPPRHPEARRNLVFLELPGQQLLLDLYRPDTDRPTPVVIYFHSGGWRAGNKDDCRVRWLTRYGFAVASVSYRLLPRYRFPVQIQDAKAAVRFLRGNAETLGLNPDQFAAAGLSSGAQIACLLGLTHGHPVLDQPSTTQKTKLPHPGLPEPGQVPDYSGESTEIQAVVNYSGLVDFVSIQNRPTRRGGRAYRSAEARLLGHAVHEDYERAKLASPMYHIHADAPPFLHLHGDLNEITPIDQTRRFHAALLEAGVVSKFTFVRGTGHNSRRMIETPSIQDRVADFLHRHLQTAGGIRAVYEEAVTRTDTPDAPIAKPTG